MKEWEREMKIVTVEKNDFIVYHLPLDETAEQTVCVYIEYPTCISHPFGSWEPMNE